MRLASLLLALLPGLPCPAAPAPSALPTALRARLEAIVDDPALGTGFAGALVVAAGRRSEPDRLAGRFGLVPYDGARRPELFAHNADKVFSPASNMKLVTAAATLDRLGPDYRFVTRVAVGAAPRNGDVDELYLIGGGDPSLARADLAGLAKQVVAAGVTRVTGGVHGDESRYATRFGYGWTVDDLPWYYAAEATALTLDRNFVTVKVTPGAAAGEAAQVTVTPATPAVPVESSVTTVASGRLSVDFDRDVDAPAIRLTGTIPADAADGASERMAVPHPALWATKAFAGALREAGVEVSGDADVRAAPAGALELARHESKPLGELTAWLLKYSDNLYAELYLRELGYQASGHGTAAAGAQAVQAFLDRHQVRSNGLRLADGSGLSRYNLISPRTLAGVLRVAAFSRYAEPFFAGLPIAGSDGTLASRMRGTAAAGRVNAKTGYISNHTGLSGYVTTRGGDLLIVSTIWNHFTTPTAESRRCHDAFFTALAEWTR